MNRIQAQCGFMLALFQFMMGVYCSYKGDVIHASTCWALVWLLAYTSMGEKR